MAIPALGQPALQKIKPLQPPAAMARIHPFGKPPAKTPGALPAPGPLARPISGAMAGNPTGLASGMPNASTPAGEGSGGLLGGFGGEGFGGIAKMLGPQKATAEGTGEWLSSGIVGKMTPSILPYVGLAGVGILNDKLNHKGEGLAALTQGSQLTKAGYNTRLLKKSNYLPGAGAMQMMRDMPQAAPGAPELRDFSPITPPPQNNWTHLPEAPPAHGFGAGDAATITASLFPKQVGNTGIGVGNKLFGTAFSKIPPGAKGLGPGVTALLDLKDIAQNNGRIPENNVDFFDNQSLLNRLLAKTPEDYRKIQADSSRDASDRAGAFAARKAMQVGGFGGGLLSSVSTTNPYQVFNNSRDVLFGQRYKDQYGVERRDDRPSLYMQRRRKGEGAASAVAGSFWDTARELF